MPIRFPPPLTCAGLVLATGLIAAPAQAAQDPLEGVNRRIHAFNQGVQAYVLGPATEAYLAVTSPGFRTGIANALSNLGEPVTAVSSLAAGDVTRATNAVIRFGINTTLGLGGVNDAAGPLGFPRRPFGLADAACAWGVPRGPYLVLPVLGPTTLRDASAMATSVALLAQAVGPEAVIGWRTSEMFVSYSGIHHELRRIDAEALDSYAVHRSAYLQRRSLACPGDAVDDEE